MGTTPIPLPSKEELEREQLRLTNEKLKQEAKPEKWWSKVIKNIIAIGGIATVAGTVFGLWDTYDKTITDRENARMADQRTQIERAIERLESPSTISKLIGVSVLSEYLRPTSPESNSTFAKLYCYWAPSRCARSNNGDVRRQILSTLANAMAAEKDPQIQAAYTNLIASLPKDGLITKEQWGDFHKLLVQANQALTAKGDLVRHRHFAVASPISDEENIARVLGKIIAINVRNIRVPAHLNYRGIYCEGCDFRDVIFSEKVDFTGAVLDNADFSGATMKSAIFDNAEIVGTKFVETDLRDAQFRSLAESTLDSAVNDRVPPGRTAYIDHVVSALDKNAIVKIVMPNFSCANLEGANFERHALFPGVLHWKRIYTRDDQSKVGWYQNVPEYLKDTFQTDKRVEFHPILAMPPKFFKAKIGNAKLEDAYFFDFIGVKDDFPNINGRGIRIGDIASFQGGMTDDGFQIRSESNKKGAPPDKSNRDKDRNEELDRDIRFFQRRMLGAFYSVSLGEASLPENLMAFLKQKEPTMADYAGAFRDPLGLSTADDPDLKCDRKYN